MAPKRQRGSSSRPADDEDVEIQGGSDEGDAGAGPSEPQHQRRQQRRGASASASGGAAAGAAAAAPATDRAAQAADIARRRAAHFARFQDDADGGGADGDGGDNVHVGGDNVSFELGRLCAGGAIEVWAHPSHPAPAALCPF